MSTVTGHLTELEASGLIRLAQVKPELEYLFRHALVQDASYRSLLGADRQRLHGAVGRAMEHLYADRLDEYAATLALHFDQAGDRQRALQYYVQAGDGALASYANQEAESHFRSALDLSSSDPQRVTLLSNLGQSLVRQDRIEEGLALWRTAIDLCRSLGDLDAVARLYSRSARAADYVAERSEGLRLCLEGLEAVAGAPESGDQARLLHETARAYHFGGQPAKGEPLCRLALEMAERQGAVDVQADALATLGIFPQLTVEEALSTLRKAVELAEANGLLYIASRAHNNLGVLILTLLEDARASLPHFLRSASLARKRGGFTAAVSALMSVVGQSLALGDLAKAEETLRSMEQLTGDLPDPGAVEYEMHFIRGYMASFKGDFDQALELLRLTRSEARQRGDLITLFNSSTEIAHAVLEMDRLRRVESWEEAEGAVREAIALADRGLGSTVSPRCELSAVYARKGCCDEARRALAEAELEAALHPSTSADFALRTAQLELAIAEERWAEALAAVEQVAAFQLRRERAAYWASAIEVWADVHLRRGKPGDPERAYILLRKARAIYQELSLVKRAAWVDERLEALRTETFARARARDMVAHELAVAARIQAGLLPEALPTLPGWEMAVALEPARETSGDFYDFIPLPGGRLAIVVADVADKGAGAALYMALTRTLLRSSVAQHPQEPGQVLATVNARILAETHTDMFVTVFCGLLDPETGSIAYANGGHNPPHLFQSGESRPLVGTGMALGVVPDASWETDSITLSPGDTLLLYTDGALDAQTLDGDSFGLERLLAATQAHLGTSPVEIQAAILDEIHSFVGEAPRFDDLTLMVAVRT